MIKEEKSDSPGFSRRSFLKRLTLALVGVWAPKKIGHLITGPEFNVAHAQDHLLSKIELCRENINRIQELYRLFGFETSSTADKMQIPRWIGFGPPVKWETQLSAQDRARNCEVAHVAARQEVEKLGKENPEFLGPDRLVAGRKVDFTNEEVLVGSTGVMLDLVKVDYETLIKLFEHLSLIVGAMKTHPLTWGVVGATTPDRRLPVSYFDWSRGLTYLWDLRQAMHETWHAFATALRNGRVGDQLAWQFFDQADILHYIRWEMELQYAFYQIYIGQPSISMDPNEDNRLFLAQWVSDNSDHSLDEFCIHLTQYLSKDLEGTKENDPTMLQVVKTKLNGFLVKKYSTTLDDVLGEIGQNTPSTDSSDQLSADEKQRQKQHQKQELIKLGRMIEQFIISHTADKDVQVSPLKADRDNLLYYSLTEIPADAHKLFYLPLAQGQKIESLLAQLPLIVKQVVASHFAILNGQPAPKNETAADVVLRQAAARYLAVMPQTLLEYSRLQTALQKETKDQIQTLRDLLTEWSSGVMNDDSSVIRQAVEIFESVASVEIQAPLKTIQVPLTSESLGTHFMHLDTLTITANLVKVLLDHLEEGARIIQDPLPEGLDINEVWRVLSQYINVLPRAARIARAIRETAKPDFSAHGALPPDRDEIMSDYIALMNEINQFSPLPVGEQTQS